MFPALFKPTQVQLAVATAFVGLYGCMATAQPAPQRVNGEIREGGTVVVEGSGFQGKPHGPPLFWWTADGGDKASVLGRLRDWSGGWDGDDERQQLIVAPGSKFSYRFDHGASTDAALGRVDFQSSRVYMWRKKYDGFDITTDYAIRVKIKDISGSFAPGQTVRGLESGATGVIVQASGNLLRFANNAGTINQAAPVDFVRGEQMVGPSGRAINDENNGVFRTFNWKTTRFWPNLSQQATFGRNNVHVNAQGATNDGYRVTPEHTDRTRYYNSFLKQRPREWAIEQVVYEASAVDESNGRFWFSINNEFGYRDLIRTRSAENPNRYAQIFQSQVSHLAQPESWVYYDSLYIDESWHRVLLSSAPLWSEAKDVEIQIPVRWSPDRIEMILRYGSLSPTRNVYLYVVDGENRVNERGLLIRALTRPNAPGALRTE